MKIFELEKDTTLTFILNLPNQKLEFPSKVVDCDSKAKEMYAEAVIHNGQTLGLGSAKGALDVIASFPDDKPILFSDIKAVAIKYDSAKCYEVTCENPGKAINRRGSYRCFVGTHSEVNSGVGAQPYPAVVKDVSATGFAVILDEANKLEIGQLVYCAMHDTIESTGEDFNFSMFGIVVRTQELDRGKVVYGCQHNKPVIGIDKYIAKKEREELQKHRSK